MGPVHIEIMLHYMGVGKGPTGVHAHGICCAAKDAQMSFWSGQDSRLYNLPVSKSRSQSR
jgi:hypothetical protein